jgi:hypothetical protein
MIPDTKPIHAPYLIRMINAKSWFQKMGLLANKKGKSMR